MPGYDGYHFGHMDVYCPWDVLNQCYKLCKNADAKMEPHWENSSSNAIIQDMIEDATETATLQNVFNEFMSDSISIRDTFIKKELKENLPTGKAITKSSKGRNSSACFYHGMLLVY